MKFTFALAATFNVAADETCGPVMPMLPLQYACPDGSPVVLNDLTSDNWATKTCSNSRSRRSMGSYRKDKFGHCWFVGACKPECDGCKYTRRAGGKKYCVYDKNSFICKNPPRNNDQIPGEDPNWVSEEQNKELEMNSPYNMVVNIVNVESPYEDKVQADGLDQVNKLVKSILISLFEKSINAKYLFILEGSNTSQIYHAVADQECPSLTALHNGLLVVDEASNGQKAIPSKLSKNLGYETETWDSKFGNLLGYLEENVDTQHEKIMVNHFQFAKNAKIDEAQAKNTTTELDQWRATMASKGSVIKEIKLAFHFIGSDAEHSFDQLEDAMKGRTNSQSISFRDENDNSVKAVEFNDNILLLNYESGVSDKLERPDVFPILKIMKSFIDYDSYFDLKKMSSTYSSSSTLVSPLLSLMMIAVAHLLF